ILNLTYEFVIFFVIVCIFYLYFFFPFSFFFFFFFFFFNDTATTEIYTLSLHDALPIFSTRKPCRSYPIQTRPKIYSRELRLAVSDRKSTRLNSSHLVISYAVFCLKKKKKKKINKRK